MSEKDKCPYIVTGDEGTSYCRLAQERPRPAEITDAQVETLFADLIKASDAAKQWLENEHCDTDFDRSAYLAETHAALSLALRNAKSALEAAAKVEA